MLFSLVLVDIISLPQKGFLTGIFLADQLGSNENLTRTIKR